MISRDQKADYRNHIWKEIPLPQGFTVEQTGDRLQLRLHWFSLAKFLRCCFGGSMLLATFGTSLVTGLDELLRGSPWVLVFMISLACAGAAAHYPAPATPFHLRLFD